MLIACLFFKKDDTAEEDIHDVAKRRSKDVEIDLVGGFRDDFQYTADDK